MKSNIQLRGEFKLKVYDRGELVEDYHDANLVVDSGLELVQLLLSSAADDKFVDRVAFGELLTAEPIAPTSDQTTVPNRIDITSGGNDYKLFDSITYPTNRSVSFNWTLTGAQGNGFVLSYFGLLNSEDTLFAAKSRPGITKTSDIVLEGTWILHY